MSDTILMAKDLKKSFGDLEAVKGISFSILKGEIFSLLGPNGAGKTTTISMLCSLLAPTAGEAEIGGYSVAKDPMAVKRLIGVVPQDLALYQDLNAEQNLVFWGNMYGMDKDELKVRMRQVLEQVSLADRAKDRVSTYSGGMKRRLNIAVGLLHKPQLVFMDEPTVGIDPQSRRSILDMVKQLRNQGMTVLYTTHYMEEAEELSDRVGIIDLGKLIALGTQKELTRLVGEMETLRLHFGEEESGEQILPVFQALVEKPDQGVVRAATAVDHEIVLTVTEAANALPAVVLAAQQAGLRIHSIDIQEPNLESVFLHLTGRALRD
ncbi:MAG: ATP-binding cassette domain-containing protein [Anaerolineales bacterium]|nr:ATP-binding cassette domain-containing protein [Anaerolineales bacterium]